jgi:hypothetical protein
MATVSVEVENGSGQVVRFSLEENGEQHEYLRKQLRRDELRRVEVVKPAARKPATTK